MADETVRRRAYGGQSADQRKAVRRGRLIDAALTSMADGAWRAETVARLCARAELNKRYFYESFTDLDQLAVAAIDQIAQEVGQAALDAYAASAGLPLAGQARAAIGAVVHGLADDPRKARVLFGMVGGPPLIQQHRAAVVQGLTEILMDHARAIHGVELAADSLARTAPPFVVGGTAETILAWVNGTVAVPLDILIDDLTTLWLITGNGAADHARHRVRNP
ncbi:MULTISPECIES: TetR/AcrR family transcriptional regulator [unclassified Actinomadura]|uniref:TetR/AcrR family transcriptional regulator n=1 Tax=unclassified Actinomadura TaxID=2626254 RepID=UPI0011F07187|nr:TetR/AcrR family transcriptional regulator [Actinomadura sp. K4S16]